MTSTNPHPTRRICACVAALLLSTLPAAAQEDSAPAVDLTAGWVGFADDGIVTEFPIGAAARWYLSPRISIGPEVIYIFAEQHSHQIVTGNLTFDFRSPRNGVPRLTPFVVIGAGMFRTSEGFVNRPPFSSTEGAFTIGGGVRAPLSERVGGGVDARVGWEPYLRITGFVSIGLSAKP